MAYVRPIGFWLKLVDALVDDRYATVLERHGVTRAQWQLLDALDGGPQKTEHLEVLLQPFVNHDGISPRLDDHLDELVESHWVLHTAAAWSLTARGRIAVDQLEEAVAAEGRIVMQGIDPAQFSSMLDVLEQLAHNYGYRAS